MYNYGNTNLSDESLATLAPTTSFFYTALHPPCAGFEDPFLWLGMLSNNVTMIIFSTTRHFQFDIPYPVPLLLGGITKEC